MGNTTTKTITAIALTALCAGAIAQDGGRLAGATVVDHSIYTNLPNFIKLNPAQTTRQQEFVGWATYALNLPQASDLKPYETFSDEYGYTHTRHRQYMNGYPVEGTQVISHLRDGKVTMVNGDYYQQFSSAQATINEEMALKAALKKVNAQRYMWENDAFERATGYDYTPKGELVYVHKKDADYSAANLRLAYKFNIYAEVPLYRANVFVDAVTGEILDEQNQICTVTVVGTGVTKYSGTVTMSSDNNGGTYTLNETGRGNGIHTYNLQNGTSYVNTNFTNTSSTWNLAGADKAASDAHWGAEMTYDYYKLVHNRNSIDGNGYALNSYVHYSTNYLNAFWNGQCMTYGDGDGSQFGIMTALDVCGHEITHGLCAYTAGLGGSGEPGALNEAFADIMGTSMEWYARPSQKDWKMGYDISLLGSNVRDLQNEHLSGEGAGPNCYQESGYWDAGQEVHINSGPAGHWYYLLCQGGTGTSGCGNSYNVTAITMAKAEKIAFRGLTVYFTPSTTYANARTYTEQAAVDIYGSCSAELTATSSAWYAVNVGGVPTTGAPTANFTTGTIPTCGLPVAVSFVNNSTGAQSYSWNFGDGGTSTATAPTHTYTSAGTFVVTLVATGCGGSTTNTYTQSVTISATGGAALPLSEGFESSTSLPAGWTVSNPDNDATWVINTTVAKTGTHCLGMNNCDGDGATDMTGRIDQCYIKSYNFSNLTSAAMTFDIAYSQLIYQGTPYNDVLDILVSTNCGQSWTNVYSKGGATLSSAGSYTSVASCWVPSSAAQWRNDNVNLTPYINNPSVMIAFKNTSAWGTWIYIDNINLTGTTGININNVGDVSVYPNPAHNSITINGDKLLSSVSIIDMLGKTVLAVQPNDKSVQVDISSLPAGMYFAKVSSGDGQKLVRLVKE